MSYELTAELGSSSLLSGKLPHFQIVSFPNFQIVSNSMSGTIVIPFRGFVFFFSFIAYAMDILGACPFGRFGRRIYGVSCRCKSWSAISPGHGDIAYCCVVAGVFPAAGAVCRCNEA